MAQNGVFGTNIEMHALSWLTGRPIQVFSDQENIPDLTVSTDSCVPGTDPILLTHQWNNHFNCAQPIGESLKIGIGVCIFFSFFKIISHLLLY